MNILIITGIVHGYCLLTFIAIALGEDGLAWNYKQIIEHAITPYILIFWRQSFVYFFAVQNQHEKDFGST